MHRFIAVIGSRGPERSWEEIIVSNSDHSRVLSGLHEDILCGQSKEASHLKLLQDSHTSQ